MRKYKTEEERRQAKRESDRRYRARKRAEKNKQKEVSTSVPRLKIPGVETAVKKPYVTHVGIVTDHSASMHGIHNAAKNDFNQLIRSIGDQSNSELENYITHVMCGANDMWYASNVVRLANIPATRLNNIIIDNYNARGGSTPLYDSIKMVIENLEALSDAKDSNVSFLVQVITDGHENSSRQWSGEHLRSKIEQLQRTDKWTFTFRVPKGHASTFTRLGIPVGNIYEWDGRSEQSLHQSTVYTEAGINTYFTARSHGQTYTQKFYADLATVSSDTVAAKCVDISADICIWPISKAEDGIQIRDFVDKRTKGNFKPGNAFYQLVKLERRVQPYKKIIIRDKNTKAVYGGDAARQLLKLPTNQDIRLAPGDHGDYDIFIQSTSVNRKLSKGTEVIFCESAS